ncbi:MAG: hypothetical protein ACI9FR_000204 [Cryomorphaceae bacterium]
MVIEPAGDIDLCWADPGFEVDVYVETDLRTMTAIWMGLTTAKKELSRMNLKGVREIVNSMQTWLGLSPFAAQWKFVG